MKTWGLLLCAFIVCVMMCSGCVMFSDYEYSEGHRDGKLQKVSHKGIVWKTWEAEVALEGYSRTKPSDGQTGGNVWSFTATVAVTRDLEQYNSEELLRFYYKQKLVALPWRGDTTYFVYRVEKLK